MSKLPMSKREFFPVLSIEREDISQAMGYNLGSELSDEQMRRIAVEFDNMLMTPWNWNILACAVESVVDVNTVQGTITIEVESGVVTAVRGLPENYQYEVLYHNVTGPTPKVETRARCLDTSLEAGVLLHNFKERLRRVREGITDLDGTLFACFPFQFSQGNVTCRGEGSNPNSPVCVLCRRLNGYDWVYT